MKLNHVGYFYVYTPNRERANTLDRTDRPFSYTTIAL